jgi:hypothetical protein
MTMCQASETNLKVSKWDFRRLDLFEGELPHLFPYDLLFPNVLQVIVGTAQW